MHCHCHCHCHHQHTHCPYCCPESHHGHYGSSCPYWRRGREGGYERDAIRERNEMLKDELKALEDRLAQLEGPK